MSAATGGPVRRMLFEPNTQLGRFRVQRHLGHGSLADVYLARDTACDQDVAIKVVQVAPGDKAAAARLQCERSLCGLIRDHSHVVRVYDIHPIQLGGAELLVLSMEYADGGSLRDWLRDHRDNWQNRRVQAQDCFRQICEGVRVIHESGLVGLDLKPENVLLVGGVWKIADFSASSSMACEVAIQMHVVGRATGQLERGTPVYSSPEQFRGVRGGNVDARADIYSLGIILYELLHPESQPPFVGSDAQLQNLHKTATLPSLPGASPTETRVVGRCLCKNPAERYRDVNELLEDLESSVTPSDTDEAGQEGAATTWRDACQCMEEGRFDHAQRLCQHLLERHPNHAEAKGLAEELQARNRLAEELYATIEDSLDKRSLDDLCSLLYEAANTYPEHPAGRLVQIKLQLKARHYRVAMQEGRDAINHRDWFRALTWFERARQLSPGACEPELAVRLVSSVVTQIQETRQRINQAVAVGDRERAMSLARELDDYIARIASRPGGQQA
ncbi:MAG: serine/threonine-protein kinase [Phycisphaerae bacterium]|nr:serine/threonine-protein kinase [Phycisphaerae bacterium]